MTADAVSILIQKGHELWKAPKEEFVRLSNEEPADRLLNNIVNYPHAYVLACVMDRQIRAERAWAIPYRISEKLGGFEFAVLQKLTPVQIQDLMAKPRPLHRFVDEMSKNFYEAIQLIERKYASCAANIWADTPTSAELVYRFLEFRGVGPKIATMAANILVRSFKVRLKDYYSIDISVDVQVKRVFERLRLIEPGSTVEQIVYRARALHPEFPGLFDFPSWEVGRTWCSASSPNCSECDMRQVCPTAGSVQELSGSELSGSAS